MPKIPHTFIKYAPPPSIIPKPLLPKPVPSKFIPKSHPKIEEIHGITPPRRKSPGFAKNIQKPVEATKRQTSENASEKIPLLKLRKMTSEDGFIEIDKNSASKMQENLKSPTKVDREKDELIKTLMHGPKKGTEKIQDSFEDSLLAEYEVDNNNSTEKIKEKYASSREYTSLFKKLKGAK